MCNKFYYLYYHVATLVENIKTGGDTLVAIAIKN